jgi:hypothetical protein
MPSHVTDEQARRVFLMNVQRSRRINKGEIAAIEGGVAHVERCWGENVQRVREKDWGKVFSELARNQSWRITWSPWGGISGPHYVVGEQGGHVWYRVFSRVGPEGEPVTVWELRRNTPECPSCLVGG